MTLDVYQTIFEMSNIPSSTHNILAKKYPDLKINIRQPGMIRKYNRDVSVKIFRRGYRSVWVIFIDRNTGELTTQPLTPIVDSNPKLQKAILTHLGLNWRNYIELWDDPLADYTDQQWV